MKNSSITITLNSKRPAYRVKKRENILFFMILIFLVFLISSSCNSSNSDETVSEVELNEEKVHLAFAGGGWRAHSGHSAWTMSLLQNGAVKLDDVFSKVEAISSNSGGSWFSTMLIYSPSFVNSIQAPNAIQSSSSLEGGWIGGQYKFFKETGCTYHGFKYMPCVILETLPKIEDDFYWDMIVKDMVFKDFPIQETVTLKDAVQPWAKGKPLLLASTMLTNEVVLNASSDIGFNRIYQACCNPSNPQLKGEKGAICSGDNSMEVTPVTFSRMPSGSNYTAPPFFSQDNGEAVFNIGYRENYSGRLLNTTIQNPIVNDGVPVVTAAAASSAALGFAASEKITGSDDESWFAEDAALSFSLANSTAKYKVVDGDSKESLEDLTKNKMVRLADGGPVDNSGVAQLVSFIQQNKGTSDTIHIVAFDNVTTGYPLSGLGSDVNVTEVGIDIANLFGKGLSPSNKICAEKDKYCITVPELQIFELYALQNTESKWTHTENNNKLIYTKYVTTTIANPVFNVSGNTPVVLHAFSCIYPTADTAPMNRKGAEKFGFGAYGDMISFINRGLTQNNDTGLIHLYEALMLTAN